MTLKSKHGKITFEWGLYSTVINQRAIDSQSTESVFVRPKCLDFLYSTDENKFTSMKVREIFKEGFKIEKA